MSCVDLDRHSPDRGRQCSRIVSSHLIPSHPFFIFFHFFHFFNFSFFSIFFFLFFHFFIFSFFIFHFFHFFTFSFFHFFIFSFFHFKRVTAGGCRPALPLSHFESPPNPGHLRNARKCLCHKIIGERALARPLGSQGLVQSASINITTLTKASGSGSCIGPQRFPPMCKLAGERVHTAEERKSLPSEESQHVAHRGLKFPSRDTLASQKASESFAGTTKTFHGEKGSQPFDFDVKSKRPSRTSKHRDLVYLEPASLEIILALIER